ncbi:hypothetical protein JCM9140_3228 [Halalkalibacter wakoensis JCM 9140]|uniref:Uncharacterized protein n=1 Tax=Halalkalibacter wakoensis JCM 9140 TaxID=1236970 RepID=W4Q537_9BACI|nr:hypothetical protein [Halalkalibacter wakoensis]GAE27112.1 hypothetical protein JCM9140_3228 [Halalkalibacter wakoensis JCM 9140]
MAYKMIVIVSLLISFILPSFSPLADTGTEAGSFDSPVIAEHANSGNIGGLHSSTSVSASSLLVGTLYVKIINRYSKLVREFLNSSIPLLKVNGNLITIKFQSSFFSSSSLI